MADNQKLETWKRSQLKWKEEETVSEMFSRKGEDLKDSFDSFFARMQRGFSKTLPLFGHSKKPIYLKPF